ncbi:MAG: VWA domain-containing protein, partial [Parvularculaceae bacterium]|nr:VWA domain-containing protein [Parvularculaceae bacterium]
KYLSEEEKAQIEKLGGWEELMKTLEERLNEQKERHEGGNKWIGTGGTSPFGHSGYNPEGVRIGGQSKNKRAVKVWEQRQFKNLDGDVELGTRNIKVALRKLRKFARQGAPDEFDLGGTIDATAKSGYLDVQMRPERRNAVKLLVFFDVGGSMDPYVKVCEELFSAVRSEFKHLEYFYFHNFLYDFVWKDNSRRWAEKTQTWDVLHKYGNDYMVLFVGDASMSPYEITMPGGSVEYYNKEAGAIWMKRLLEIYEKSVWLNPIPEKNWQWAPSIDLTRQLFEDRMFPLTLDGLEGAIKELKR